ncbi:MAG: cobalamin biosynthesis protein [Methanobrevibacter sp.]|uniref:cobalamin biosynthesis protein n=1 Tax=Methanobrevibacter sp. TaxID=66852 RepID=UPI0025D55B96|nr:cobalamin biosynthesis protein [Methanobrevibacter sp.]MBQ8016512.1 cobalamin biosynthesis protein [Methanobrevibacter sp.]MBQ9027118.1 cobalamin biosynthesis protein [Methanobrevibacter sp.]
MIEYNNLLNDILLTKISSITSFNLFLFIIFALLLSLTVDIILGELPTKIHPVVIIGSMINFFKSKFIRFKNKLSGLFVILGVCIVSSVILYIIYLISSINLLLFIIIFIILLSSTFSVKMLLQTAVDVKKAFDVSIDKARQLVSYLVSRDTNELTESFIVSATIESLTENITDSYIAPVFYYFIFGLIILYYPINDNLYYLLLIPMFYRISNTMDAMLGYKTEELKNIGYVPAKIDDILNYIPARIAGLFVVVSAFLLNLDGKNAYKIMRRDARKCPSPNSGFTMATTAGALNIQLIKKDTYILGDDNKVITKDDISKAVNLSKLTILLFTITIILLFTLINVIL